MSATILVADDDTGIRTVLNQALGRAGYQVRSTGTAAGLWRLVQDGEGDLIITDVMMPDENAFELLPRIKKLRPDLPIVVMSAQNTMLTAIKATERGAYEYLPKPFDLNVLLNVVQRALMAPKGRAAEPAPKPPSEEQMPLIGRSTAMQEIYRTLARLMATDLTVTITGESGTGKELVAKALHEEKHGKLKSGRGGKGGTVKSRKQAIAIGLSEARAEGKKVPKKKSSRKTAKKKAAKKKTR